MLVVRAARSMSANVVGLVGCGCRRERTPRETTPTCIGRSSPAGGSAIPAGRARRPRARDRSHELAVRLVLELMRRRYARRR
jgi:hypothetical protein